MPLGGRTKDLAPLLAIFIGTGVASMGVWAIEHGLRMAFMPIVFRWGIPVLRETVQFPRGVAPFLLTGDVLHFRIKEQSPQVYLFRTRAMVPFGVITPFPIAGTVHLDDHQAQVVARLPVGPILFLASFLGIWSTLTFSAVFDTEVPRKVLAILLGGLLFLVAIIVLSIFLERHRARSLIGTFPGQPTST